MSSSSDSDRRADPALTAELQAAFDIARIGVWHWDFATDHIRIVQPSGPISGLPVALRPTHGAAFMALVHPDDRAAVQACIQIAKQTGKYLAEYRVLLPGGTRHWVLARGQCVVDATTGAAVLTGIDMDVSDRRQAEEAQRQSEALLRDAQRNARIGSWRYRPGGALTWSEQMYELVPLPPGVEPTYDAVLALLHPDDRARGDNNPFAKALLSGAEEFEGEHRILLPDGRIRTLLTVGRIQRDDDGHVIEAGGTVQDITDRKHAALVESERHRAEERFREVVENIQEVFWIVDPGTGALLYISPAYETIWGRPRDSVQASAHTWRDPIHPDDHARVMEAVSAQQAHGEYHETYRISRPDGSIRWIRDRAFPIRDASGKLERIVGTAVDITEQRHLEDQFRQAQKMESIGRLAGGIAHDFNNLLTVINGMADLAIGNLGDHDPLRADLEQIRLAGERAATLTSQLLALSRQQMLKAAVIDLNRVVGDMQAMLRRLIGEDVELRFMPAPALGRIKADPGQIEQVVLNLAVNARDAMPDGGTLTLETRNVELNGGYATTHPSVAPGPHVMIAVSDTGIGMDDATQQRIFEPFFTTKPPGQGTGLGLSTVYGIVKQSGGSIWTYSEPSRGTTFKLYFPRVGDVASPQVTHAPHLTQGNETILLVEDEQALRNLSRRVLQSAGYVVLEASTGQEALRLLETHAAQVHLMVTDVVMPGMSGRELASRLAEVRPDVKVLYVSGYTDDAILRHGVLDDVTRFLSKPYSPAQLRRKVRDVLDGVG